MRDTPMDRRTWLRGAAALACSPLLPAYAGSLAPRPRRFVDVHHHFVAPAFADFNARFVPGSGPLPWKLEDDLRDMDASHTTLAVLSGFTPSIGGTIEDRRTLSRGTNDFGAQLAARHPGRFALFATLPLPDIDGSLREAAYAFDTLHAVGLTVYTDAAEHWLGDPIFDNLYKELDRRNAVVFVHPHAPVCCTNIVPNVPDTLIEFGTATSRTIASLIFNGTTQRFPNIRWIFSHGGGTIPFLIERLLGNTSAEIVPGIRTTGGHLNLKQPPAGALAELRRMYFDTAQIANPVALRALRSVVGSAQILYGTDHWFRSNQETAAALCDSHVFTPAELNRVAFSNLETLIPSLQATSKDAPPRRGTK